MNDEVRSASGDFESIATDFRGAAGRVRAMGERIGPKSWMSNAAVTVGREQRTAEIDADFLGYHRLAAGASQQRVCWAGAALVVGAAERDWTRAEELMRAEGIMSKDLSGGENGFDDRRIDQKASDFGDAMSGVDTIVGEQSSRANSAPVSAAYQKLAAAAERLRAADHVWAARELDAERNEYLEELSSIMNVRENIQAITEVVAAVGSPFSGNMISNGALGFQLAVDGLLELATMSEIAELEQKIAKAEAHAAALRNEAESSDAVAAAKDVRAASSELVAALEESTDDGVAMTQTLGTIGRKADDGTRARGDLPADREQHAATGIHLGTLARANDSATAEAHVMSELHGDAAAFAKEVYLFIGPQRKDRELAVEAAQHEASATVAAKRERIAGFGVREAKRKLRELAPAMRSLRAHVTSRGVPR